MEPFRYHVFICDQRKPDGVPCCAARGAGSVIEALRREVAARHLTDEVQITVCGSLGLCESGPNLVVYPDGVWYSGVSAADVPEIVRSHFEGDVPVERLARQDAAGVRAEIVGNREKFYAAQRAREAAGVMPDEFTQMLRGYQESRALLTAIELDLFTAVGQGATAAEVAARIGAAPRSTEMLLNAIAAMGALAKCDGVFRNTPLSARWLCAGSPDDARAGLLHTAHLWPRWSTLTECVRAGTAVGHEPLEARGADWTQAFIAAMHRNALDRAPQVAAAAGAGAASRMLDVGGGSGAYAIAFARANPRLQADVLDLPAVVEIAAGHIAAAGLADRIRTRPGDLRRDDLGRGYDLVLVSAICHMLAPEENLDLLRRCRAALVPGGRLVVQDFILAPDKTSPRSAALFALNMLVGTEAGSSYSEPEYSSWMRQAGFTDVRHVRLPGPASLMLAA